MAAPTAANKKGEDSVKESRGQPKNGALHQAVLSGNFLESIFDIENQEANGSSGGSNPSF
jgi:hypothetical protein